MKKKNFSIVCCLIICLSAMFIVTGCKNEDEKKPISEEHAEIVFTEAITHFDNQTKMEMETSIFGVETKLIMLENVVYSEIDFQGMVSKSWTEVEADGIYIYTYSKYILNNELVETYTKTKEEGIASLREYFMQDSPDISSEAIADFVEGYIKGDDTVIVLSQEEDGVEVQIVITIEDGKIESMEAIANEFSMEIEFEYDDDVDIIPEKANPVDGWQEGSSDDDFWGE